MTLRCVIVDDNPEVLRAASELLERQGVTVVGLAVNGEEALRVTEETRPDVVLVDIGLGPESGFDVVRRLAQGVPTAGPRTVLISTHEEADFADLIAASPALGFLSKSDLSAQAIHLLLERGRPPGPIEPPGR
jgi:DNA-binding NarL/FixJ family response regulator